MAGLGAKFTKMKAAAPAPRAHRSMAVACGFLHTLAVAEEGRVLAGGWGAHGQLALGDTQNRLRMTRLAGDFTVRVVMVSTGCGHSALQDSDGELWMCGCGSEGQLGTGGREDMLTPTRVPKWRLGRARVKMAACGEDHTLVLTEASRVWAFGRGEDGRLGTGDEDDRTTPTAVSGLRGVTIAGCLHGFIRFASSQLAGRTRKENQQDTARLGWEGLTALRAPARYQTTVACAPTTPEVE